MSTPKNPTGDLGGLTRRESLRLLGTGAMATLGGGVLALHDPAPAATPVPQQTAAATAAPKVVGPASITFWSMWASEPGKRKFVDDTIAAYQTAHPGIKITVTWYEKAPLNQALTTAFMAGSGTPDMFYEDVITYNQFIDSGWMADLKGKLDENQFPLEGFEVSMRRPGKVYGVPLEGIISTVWYNAKIFRDMGITVPDSRQMTQKEFETVMDQVKAKGLIPLAGGAADTAWGGFHGSSFIMRVAGKDKFSGLLDKRTTWSDPDVVQGLRLAKSWFEKGYFNDTIQTLKATEAYQLFFQRKTAMIYVGSFLLSNATNPPDKGGAPTDFEFGVMMFPSVDGGKGNRLIGNRTGGMYSVYSKSKYIDICADFLNFMGRPEGAVAWMQYTNVPTWLKAPAGAKVHPMLTEQLKLLETYERQNPELTNRLFNNEGAAFNKWVGSGMFDKSVTVEQMVKELTDARRRDA